MTNRSPLSVVKSILHMGRRYGFPTESKQIMRSAKGHSVTHNPGQTVLLDYSSVNIAKPVHAGHLRATLIGHFVGRINEAMGHKVIGINYLGDWGTQFGLLFLGYQKFGNPEAFEKDPMGHLFEVYVRANKDVEKNIATKKLAVDLVRRMEIGDEELLKLWRTFKRYSLEELKQTYARMGISFTEFEFESDYVEPALKMVSRMEAEGLVEASSEGVRLVRVNGAHVPLLKSDGSTLYLTRDIAAAVARHEKYNFNRIHYVVENGQHMHFQNLAAILEKLGYTWQSEWPLHVKFGRVEGMSTRKGTAIFLRDILDAAKEEMIVKLRSTESTRVSEAEMPAVGDILGQSLLITEMLRSPRQNPLVFSWTRDNTGLVMQYCYARLCSLENQARDSVVLVNLTGDDLDLNVTCPLTLQLTDHLHRFNQAVCSAYVGFEPRDILHYAVRLVSLTNKCLRQLPVIHCTDKKEAQFRLSLFMSCRQVLDTCFWLLGITPLRRM